MYPNSALPAWQLFLMMAVPVASLVACIVIVGLVGRHPRGCSRPAANAANAVRVAEGAATEDHVRADQSGEQRAA
jgi:hypothetical protein